MSSHDGNVQARGPFRILLIIHADLLKQIDNIHVPMIHRLVETVEALRIHMIDCVAQRALQDDLHDIFPALREENALIYHYGQIKTERLFFVKIWEALC